MRLFQQCQGLASSPLKFVFQEQSYSSLHSGQSLAWDHVCCDIDNPCGTIAELLPIFAELLPIPAALLRSLRSPMRRRLSLRDSLNIIKHSKTSWNTCITLWTTSKTSWNIRKTSWNTQTLIIRCDDIGARCRDVGARCGDVCVWGSNVSYRAEVIRCDDIGTRCEDVGDRTKLPPISARGFWRLRSRYNSADV